MTFICWLSRLIPFLTAAGFRRAPFFFTASPSPSWPPLLTPSPAVFLGLFLGGGSQVRTAQGYTCSTVEDLVGAYRLLNMKDVVIKVRPSTTKQESRPRFNLNLFHVEASKPF